MPGNLTVTASGAALVIALRGSLDNESLPRIRDRLDSIIRGAEPKCRLVLDLGGADYISAGGLQAILGLIRGVNRLDGRIILSGTRGYVAEVLEITGISLLVPLSPDTESALAEF